MKFEILARSGFHVFSTRDFAMIAKIAIATATRQLGQAADRGALVRLTRGIWANPSHRDLHPLACVGKIVGPEQGYVSFLTALHLRGVISQIPREIQVATTGHGRMLVTPIATYKMFRVAPKLMREGVEWSESRDPFRIATAEKALFDALYISMHRGGRFRSFPEIDWEKVSRKRFRLLLARTEDERVVAAIERRFDALRMASEPGASGGSRRAGLRRPSSRA